MHSDAPLTADGSAAEHELVRTTNTSVVSRPATIAWILAAGAVISCAAGPGSTGSPAVRPSQGTTSGSVAPGQGGFILTSPDFQAGGSIPVESACDGPDVSPALAWTGAPLDTTALVLIVDDPDAGDFVHWIVFDLPGAQTGELPRDIATTAASPRQGQNDFGRPGWGGPCPPSGNHRYRFTLFALDRALGLGGRPDGSTVRTALSGTTILGRTSLEARYERR